MKAKYVIQKLTKFKWKQVLTLDWLVLVEFFFYKIKMNFCEFFA